MRKLIPIIIVSLLWLNLSAVAEPDRDALRLRDGVVVDDIRHHELHAVASVGTTAP